jgi:hypothetical protein
MFQLPVARNPANVGYDIVRLVCAILSFIGRLFQKGKPELNEEDFIESEEKGWEGYDDHS